MPTPKGIRVRSTPDWFALYMSVAGYGNSDNPGTQANKYVGLRNDSTAGYYLAIYSFQVTTNIAPLADLFFTTDIVGSPVRGGTRCNPSQGNPPGTVYYVNAGSSTLLTNPFVTVGGFTPNTGAGGFPLFVIPAGWAIYGVAQGGDDRFGLTWFYLPVVDPKCTQPA